MIPYSRQTIDKKDIKRVLRTLKSPWLTQGPAIAEFEKALVKYCRAKYAVAASSGTAALHLAYLAAGLKKGDEAITTPNTFVATSNMLLVIGAKPVFGDIRLDTYNLDEKKLEELVTKKTKAVVSVDFAGQPSEYRVISKIAKKYGLVFISDASHALGASHHGQKVGALSDMTIFSFHPVKSIATGEGGAILTNNKTYYEKIKLLRSHGVFKDRRGKNVMVDLGFNYRMTDIQAGLGVSQLSKLKGFISRRRKIVKWYKELLGDFKELILPIELPHNQSAWHIYVVRLRNLKYQQALHDYLISKGIGANFHYPAVYGHPYYRKNGFGNFALQSEEIYQKSCLTLPCFPALTSKQVKYICDSIKSFYRKNAAPHR